MTHRDGTIPYRPYPVVQPYNLNNWLKEYSQNKTSLLRGV